jgi:hypothetical protein
MPMIEYEPKEFNRAHWMIINNANDICAEYERNGIQLTLRQLYYQFVARDLLPNKQTEYKRLGDIVGKARMAGLIDWHHLSDLTRNLRGLAHWDTPADIISATAYQYRTDRWSSQPLRVEVWIEKDAAVSTISGVCNELDVPFFSCRGYTSLSEMWNASQRIRRHLEGGQRVLILHIGDHDPSGLDMTRDITDRLATFLTGDWNNASPTGADWDPSDLEVDRIALNLGQVRQYNPPPNPAKSTDARYQRYVRETGLRDSWELDALDPLVLAGMIRSRVEQELDSVAWNEATGRMNEDRAVLTGVSSNWDQVRDFVEDLR